jgi:3'-phosphoadenosine 5'-phosphosulfate (PAPS) 3'-phosphatase
LEGGGLGGKAGYREELETAIFAATEGGRVVRELYDRAAAAMYEKADGSPVTDADLASDRAIRGIVGERFPGDAILTEEGVDDPARVAATRCWIVDPIDGTEQFVRRTGEFDVLVALVVDGEPVVAAGFQPTTGVLCAAARGSGAWTRRDGGGLAAARLEPVAAGAQPRLATSVWFGAPANLSVVTRVAERLGAALGETRETGFSPRIFLPGRRCDAMLGLKAGEDQTMASEWDFAVSDLFIREAGGGVSDLWGRPHRYNKARPRNEGGLVAAADPATHAALLEALRPELTMA